MGQLAYFDDVATRAAFCAALVREGIAFNVHPAGTRRRVEMTGY